MKITYAEALIYYKDHPDEITPEVKQAFADLIEKMEADIVKTCSVEHNFFADSETKNGD